MAQFGDIIARLFSGGGTRGLSGDSERVLPPGTEHGVYNDFLRRHHTEQDLIADPGWFWSTTRSVLARKSGLLAHLIDQKTDTIADFTDILIVLSQADSRRIKKETRTAWQDRASAALGARFQAFCEEEDYHLLFPLRPVRFVFVDDGHARLGGYNLGLKAGEFVTGLMPNLYDGPGEHSRAEIAVLLNLPGQWQGYREVGRLYNDQLQFTLGAHWLDSYHHPALQRPLLYRLQQYADGSLVHVIHPDLQEIFRVKSHTAPDGVSVLSIVDRANTALAHLILSVVEHMSSESLPSFDEMPAAFGPGIMLPPGQSTRSGPSTGASLVTGAMSGSPHRTVVPLDLDERLFRLRERGALLQRVHFNKFMEGYDVYLGSDGSVQTSMVEPAATFQVRGRNVALIGHRVGLLLDGQPIPVGTPIPLKHDVQIGLGAETVDYRDLSGMAADGWPYLGEIRRSAGGASLVFGGVYRIGRDKSAKVRLPDEPDNENIVWLPGLVDGAMIRSRTGDIPKSRFYTDSIMVASLHAEIDLRDEPELASLARHCFTFIRRGKELISLSPVDKAGGQVRAKLRAGDEILVGNCVFEVSYPPPGAAPDFADLFGGDAQLKPPPLSADDLPAAAGLGERGPAPPRPQVTRGDGDPFEEGVSVSRGAQLALAGSSPSHFGELQQDRKSGPRLVFDEDFGAAFRKSDVQPRPMPSVADVASALHNERPEPPRQSLVDADIPTEGGQSLPSDPPLEIGPIEAASPDLGPLPSAPIPPGPIPPGPNTLAPSTLAPGVDPKLALAEVFLFESGPTAPAGRIPVPEPTAIFDEPVNVESSEPSNSFDASNSSDLSSQSKSLSESLSESLTGRDLPLVGEAEALSESGPDAWVVLEEDWQIELARPAHLVVQGWMLCGETTVTNHYRPGVALPENQSRPDQRFTPCEYFQIRVRGARAELQSLGTPDARLVVNGEEVEATKATAEARMLVLRRDDRGDPDFEIALTLRPDASLPDPRAQLLAVDLGPRVVRAMFTLGLPLREPRPITLGPIQMEAHFDGERLVLSEYLDSYRLSGGRYHPFFVCREGDSWRTAPEDGEEIALEPGDRLMAGATVYRFERT